MVVQQPNVTCHHRLVKLAEGKYQRTDCFLLGEKKKQSEKKSSILSN